MAYDFQSLDFTRVDEVGFDYNTSNLGRQFAVLSKIADLASASHGMIRSGQTIKLTTTLSKHQCEDVISDLGLVASNIFVSRHLGLFKKEVTVKF